MAPLCPHRSPSGLTTRSGPPWKQRPAPGVDLATYLRQIAAEAAPMSGVLGSGRRAQPSGGLRRNDPGRATSTESRAHRRPTPIDVPSFEPGQIVIVEWRRCVAKGSQQIDDLPCDRRTRAVRSGIPERHPRATGGGCRRLVHRRPVSPDRSPRRRAGWHEDLLREMSPLYARHVEVAECVGSCTCRVATEQLAEICRTGRRGDRSPLTYASGQASAAGR